MQILILTGYELFHCFVGGSARALHPVDGVFEYPLEIGRARALCGRLPEQAGLQEVCR